MKHATICIPARLASTRCRNKVLRMRGNIPLIVATIEAAKRVRCAKRMLVCTDSLEIANVVAPHCEVFAATPDTSWCGTNRIWRALRAMPEFFDTDVIVNWQVDEPEVSPQHVHEMVQNCRGISTLVAPLSIKGGLDRNTTKADYLAGAVTRFSRSAIGMACPMHHVGIYAFLRGVLADIGGFSQTPLSAAEELEQLTWMDRRWTVDAMVIPATPLAINTEADVERWACSTLKS